MLTSSKIIFLLLIRMGADLREEWAVNEAKFDNSAGLWTLYREGATDTFKARVSKKRHNLVNKAMQ